MKTIDCRGLACPAPVLQTKETLEKDHPVLIKVVVDNEAAKQNVSRFLKSRSFEVDIQEEGADFHIVRQGNGRGISPEPVPVKTLDTEKKKIMVMLATDKMGRGDEELGAKLMLNFIKTLKEMGDELWRLVLVNNGVKLTIENSQALPDLQALEQSGIYILVCGTCLDHFNLLDRKQVGETTNMLDIVTAMQLADKVINL